MIYFFFFNDTATTEIYTLSLHDALPIYERIDHTRVELLARIILELSDPRLHIQRLAVGSVGGHGVPSVADVDDAAGDRKSTRLNSSHANISYAVFCLKKKKINSHHIYAC